MPRRTGSSTARRKSPNHTLRAGPHDPGSPWALVSESGGHTSIHPALGTFEDFGRLVTAAQRLGIAIAMGIGFQCSPDHPYVRAHPEWFQHRPDGTVKYAENPPKKYQDIYPLDFECDAWPALWAELRDVFLFWIGHGVKIFRVDNPHTKPFHFWDWGSARSRRGTPTRSSCRRHSPGPRSCDGWPGADSLSPTRTSPGATRSGN